MPDTCRHCQSPMREGIAMESTLTGAPDFINGECVTLSEGGPGRLVAVMKCTECGWSYRLTYYTEWSGMRRLIRSMRQQE